ncbi:hypothetical protein WA1_49065 [Scytonema hofmannii PCC 7110]|uniref:Uncharacterized protein n=1 Tax=Scytonema hofmannii PCC 7110 TaxID=128403 RepID=A0A139WQI8_9CYAN|nr:hypothetical protein [Scytonema hofmannii]KYC34693.1 hypothetical protein WA1_49065 [Scytonema hofmannii PCC 7110]
MNYILVIENQEIPIEEKIAASDDVLRQAISSYYPELAHAQIQRNSEGETVKIKMIKQAGTKGCNTPNIIQYLAESLDCTNPALLLSWQLKLMEINGNLSIEQLIELQPVIDKAVEEGEVWIQAIQATLHSLTNAPSVPSNLAVTGY